MPELPDIEAYVEALRDRVVGQALQGVRLASPFVLRTVEPPLAALAGGCVVDVERLGKRIVLRIMEPAAGAVSAYAGPRTEPLFLVIHLMIAGRLRWEEPGSAIPRGSGLAAFDFANGSLILTEAGTKRRASLHVVRGVDGLRVLDPGGIDVFSSTGVQFAAAMRVKNQTLKRALTDSSVLSGIGNAYSDEILHRARLSPFKQTRTLGDAELARLRKATLEVLAEWRDRLRVQSGGRFPDKVTAFRPDMAVHGKFGRPCPVCGAAIQRIVYADSECNYCPGCQTGGKVHADRALSRLLKSDWPGASDVVGPDQA